MCRNQFEDLLGTPFNELGGDFGRVRWDGVITISQTSTAITFTFISAAAGPALGEL